MKAVYRSNFAWGLYGFLMGVMIAVVLFVATTRAVIIQEVRSPYDFAPYRAGFR